MKFYLYTSPSGIKLIEGDKMPVIPERPIGCLDYVDIDRANYKRDLQRAKEEAVTVADQEKAKKLIEQLLYEKRKELTFQDISSLDVMPNVIYGPFSLRYEISFQWRPYSTQDWKNTNEHYWLTVGSAGSCAEKRRVAILHDTPEKEPEPNFTDCAFIEKLDQASPLLSKVADIYARTNYSGHDHSIAVAKYSFIRGFNFAKHQKEPEIQHLRDKLREARKSHTEDLQELMRLREKVAEKEESQEDIFNNLFCRYFDLTMGEGKSAHTAVQELKQKFTITRK